MKLNIFKQKLKDLKDKGYISTLRKGNTGVGHTLEQLLNLKENNIAIPDLGGKIELKVQRKAVSNRITLFTKSPKWIIRPKKLINEYGYRNGRGRLALKITLTGKKTVKGLRLHFQQDPQTIRLVNGKSKVLAFWRWQNLNKILKVKLSKLIIVKAGIRYRNKKEEFHYNQAYLLSKTSFKKFSKTLMAEDLVIELRMHLKKEGGVRDHGTAFRIAENKLEKLYRYKKKII